MTKLTKADLERALEDPRRQGTLGYTQSEYIERSKAFIAKGDSLAIRTANAKGWTYDDLVVWVDSKGGRWFWDALHGNDDAAMAAREVNLDWFRPGEREATYGF